MQRYLVPLVFLLTTACEGSNERAFVGELAGTDSRIGIKVDDEVGQAYVCGGDVDRSRHHDWFPLTATDDGGFTGGKADASMDFTIDEGEVSGTVTIEGETFTFTATEGEGADGIFEPDTQAGTCRIGAIVAGGGTIVQGVFCPEGGLPVQVVPIELTDVSSDGFAAEAMAEPPVELFMSPVVIGG